MIFLYPLYESSPYITFYLSVINKTHYALEATDLNLVISFPVLLIYCLPINLSAEKRRRIENPLAFIYLGQFIIIYNLLLIVDVKAIFFVIGRNDFFSD